MSKTKRKPLSSKPQGAAEIMIKAAEEEEKVGESAEVDVADVVEAAEEAKEGEIPILGIIASCRLS
jgi:hypothetical protein